VHRRAVKNWHVARVAAERELTTDMLGTQRRSDSEPHGLCWACGRNLGSGVGLGSVWSQVFAVHLLRTPERSTYFPA
jgi:hypothetical protein